jgi:hypothetical protein
LWNIAKSLLWVSSGQRGLYDIRRVSQTLDNIGMVINFETHEKIVMTLENK